jgi:3-oxoadipate enol-lactonase
VVLLHGWTSTAALNWYRCFGALGEEHRVVALDHRGHGRGIRSRTPFRLEDCADDAAALIRELGAGPAVAVGYSMGGPVAQLLWRRHRDLVGAMVLCATAARFGSGRAAPPWAAPTWTGMATALSLVPEPVRRQAMILATRRWVAGTSAAAWAAEEWSRHDPSALLQAGLALSRFDSTGWIGQVDVPTAVVVTETDLTVAPARQHQLAAAIPGAITVPVRADHRACVDSAELFVPALRRAIRSVAAQSLTSTPCRSQV